MAAATVAAAIPFAVSAPAGAAGGGDAVHKPGEEHVFCSGARSAGPGLDRLAPAATTASNCAPATPDGQPARSRDGSVLVGREPAEAILPPAWYDPTGNWAITVTDLFGAGTEKAVVVLFR